MVSDNAAGKDAKHEVSDRDRLRLLSSTLDHAGKRIDELDTKVGILPKVDEQGRSDCPSAEHLYAEKQEAEETLEGKVEELRACMAAVQRELGRCEQNRAQIAADAGGLHLDQAKEKYAQAVAGEEAALQKLREKLQAIQQKIADAEEALEASRLKQWPLGEPQKRSLARGFAAAGDAAALGLPATTEPPQTPRPTISSNLDGLLSLGPIGRKGPAGATRPPWSAP